MIMQELITGWLFLDGKATPVKCYHWQGNPSRVIQVVKPNRYVYVFTTRRGLSKSKAACLRRQLKIAKAEFDSLVKTAEETRVRINTAFTAVGKLKEQLKYAK